VQWLIRIVPGHGYGPDQPQQPGAMALVRFRFLLDRRPISSNKQGQKSQHDYKDQKSWVIPQMRGQFRA